MLVTTRVGAAHAVIPLASGGEEDRPAPENVACTHLRDLEVGDPLYAEGGDEVWPHRPHRRVHQRAHLGHVRSRRPCHLAGTTRDVLKSRSMAH